MCKYTGEPSGGLWTTDEGAAELRARIPLLILERQHKERQRETLDWLIAEAETKGLWLWTPGEQKRLRAAWTHEPNVPQTEVGEVNETLRKYGNGWYSPPKLRERLADNPEMYYWAWTVRHPRERLESIERIIELAKEEAAKF